MMKEFENCLHVNTNDPTNESTYDYNFIQNTLSFYGLVIYNIIPPAIRGHQWVLHAKKASPFAIKATFHDDVAAIGIARPPVAMSRSQ